jgi:hypothetical protein
VAAAIGVETGDAVGDGAGALGDAGVAVEPVEATGVALGAGGVDPAAGTVAVEVRLLERVTANPTAGAVVLRRTVPVDGVPPGTLVGSRPTEATAIRAMDSPAVRFTPA